ncbi:MAG: Hsp33 family molecular chaperone HslO [Agarilytica sp.]
MASNDQIQRFLFDDTDIRGEITCLEQTFQEAHSHQHFPFALTPMFGEFLAAAALLSEVLKFEGTLTLQARGSGDVALIMAEANHKGDVRGIVRMQADQEDKQSFESMQLQDLLGESMLTITIDPLKGKRYQGVVPIQSASLAEALQGYFQQSEQLPTHIQLFASESACGGLFLQCLPAQLVTDEEQRADLWETSIQLANTLTPKELFELDSETLLIRLFHDMTCRAFSPKPTRFHCACTRERSANAVHSLGFEDAVALLLEQGSINVDCQFCGKDYEFTEASLHDIFPTQSGDKLH